MAKGIGKKKVKEIQERFSINKLDRSLALKEGFKSLGDYKSHLWSILLQEKRKDKEDIKKEIKQFYKSVKKLPTPARRDVEQRKQTFEKKIKATRLIQNAFRKFQERKSRPQYVYDILEEKHIKTYSYKNVNTAYQKSIPEEITQFITNNISNMENALKLSIGTSKGIKAKISCKLICIRLKDLYEKMKNTLKFGEVINFNSEITQKCINEIKFSYLTNVSDFEMLYRSSNLKEFITKQALVNQNEFDNLLDKGSDIVIVKVEKVYLRIIKDVSIISGSSYIELPQFIKNKQCCINIKNNDQKCAMWAIKGFKYHHLVPHHKERISHYQNIDDNTDYTMLEFPTKIDGWDKYERVNDEQVNIFGVEEKKTKCKDDCKDECKDDEKTHTIIPLRISKYKSKKGHVNRLLLIEGKDNNHYVPIINFSGFMCEQTRLTRKVKCHYCDFCLAHFWSEEKLQNHQELCREHDPCKAIYLNKDDKITFKSYCNGLFLPYIAVADGECFTESINSCAYKPSISYTQEYQRHRTSGLKYIIIDKEGNVVTQKLFEGKDIVRRFVESLDWESTKIKKELQTNIPMEDLTDEENEEFIKSECCHICNKKYKKTDKKVRDHDHLTGKYRGSAHNRCNLNFHLKNFKLPVFFHNLEKYDLKYILKEINTDKKYRLDPIAKNSESYMSLSINNFVLKDSFKFMASSLSKLVEGMQKSDLKITNSEFGDKADLMIRKGVYPYDYMNCEEKLNDTQLPPKYEFYSKLTNEEISDEDYEHAQIVWNAFNCSTMRDYHKLYLRSDVYLLSDVLMNFRQNMFSANKLDPASYISLPSYTWDAGLKMTGVELDPITDPDMYLFFEKGIRGGITKISCRYAKANNKYLNDYDSSKESTYINYLDANNLYGYAMCQKQGTGGFKWEDDLTLFTEETILKYDMEASERCFALEVDLEYPKELHDLHSDYPLAVERMTIKDEQLSPYCKFLSNQLLKAGHTTTSSEKLIGNFYDKKKYIIHVQNLQLFIQLGLKLTKVHRVLSYNHSHWIKPYIDFNTKKRAEAKSDFEKDLYKLVNNALFGKTMENVRNRIDYKLCINDDNKVNKLKAKFNMKDITEFTEQLVGVHMNKTSVKLDKPIYVGFGTLELSKHHMYDFHYNVMHKMYSPDNVKLLFTDTDSLVYQIKTNDVYEDMKNNSVYFDMSEYPEGHKCKDNTNKKVVGKFKDEYKGDPIREFVGLKSKMYALTNEYSVKETKKLKGLSMNVVKKTIFFESYKNVLNGTGGYFMRHQMNTIRSKKHQLYTITQNKVSLCAFDDKSYILDDGISTLAYGHYRICDK